MRELTLSDVPTETMLAELARRLKPRSDDECKVVRVRVLDRQVELRVTRGHGVRFTPEVSYSSEEADHG